MSVVERELEIVNRLGLHARAAAKLAKIAESFSSSIRVEKDGHVADAKSVMGMLLLCGQIGTKIRVRADGVDAADAVEAIATLVEGRFGEPR